MYIRDRSKNSDSHKRIIPAIQKKGNNKGVYQMDTKDFRTKTILIDHQNPSVEENWGISIDIGYSGTKLFSPNRVACFPSFASPVDGSLLSMGINDAGKILYRDCDSGRIWKVGKSAQDVISVQDPDQVSNAIYGRQRYFNPMYLVIARTALGIACSVNEYGNPDGRKVHLQTGLPNSYLRSDTPLIKEALAGMHVFDLKIGAGEWEHYEIRLDISDIKVMQQPIGTLLSVSSGPDLMPTETSMDYFTSLVAICDPGFGTFDSFSLKDGEMNGIETSMDFTMQKILAETGEEIFQKYHVEIPVPAMQKYLEQGYVTQFDRKARQGKNVSFADILAECNRRIAMQAIDKLSELYNYLIDYKYLILTGGTGEAWYPYFKEEFSGMPNLTVVPGNQNTEGYLPGSDGEKLPFIFSNARGYYIYQQHRLGLM